MLKPLSFALVSAVALAAAGTLAVAQDKSGQNVTKQAAEAEGAVAVIDTAQKTYAWGVAQGSAVTVAAAAQMMMSVDVADADRTPEQKPTEGGDTAEAGEGIDAPVDAAAMLAKARELAAGDEALLAMIDDIEAEGARGRIGGASRTLSRLPAGYNDYWEIPYYGNSFAELAIQGDGDADLDLLVTDENGNTICYDNSYSDQLYCSWTPLWDGYFYVTVTNVGNVRNSYYLLTN